MLEGKDLSLISICKFFQLLGSPVHVRILRTLSHYGPMSYFELFKMSYELPADAKELGLSGQYAYHIHRLKSGHLVRLNRLNRKYELTDEGNVAVYLIETLTNPSSALVRSAEFASLFLPAVRNVEKAIESMKRLSSKLPVTSNPPKFYLPEVAIPDYAIEQWRETERIRAKKRAADEEK